MALVVGHSVQQKTYEVQLYSDEEYLDGDNSLRQIFDTSTNETGSTLPNDKENNGNLQCQTRSFNLKVCVLTQATKPFFSLA